MEKSAKVAALVLALSLAALVGGTEGRKIQDSKHGGHTDVESKTYQPQNFIGGVGGGMFGPGGGLGSGVGFMFPGGGLGQPSLGSGGFPGIGGGMPLTPGGGLGGGIIGGQKAGQP